MPRTKNFDQHEVLLKAVDLFWEKGYNATSMQDLVDHLGINRASLYDTYGGKMQLFRKAYDVYKEQNDSVLETTLFANQDVRASLSAFFELLIQKNLSDKRGKGCFIVNTTTEMFAADEYIKSLILKNKEDVLALLDKRLRQGIIDEQLPKDLDTKSVALAFFSFYNGLEVLAKTRPTSDEYQDMINVFLEILE